ncbi:polysaccharide export outer membrane protein [Pseudoxanthomonas sp. GM95]|uniref:polysaccharide biosynthesis/export family protein n=1 Tax=Pseudoxanthomonas sp. GM95 TaxID=1881043 RepID=UPI0008D2A8E9|nr:polysaccharide biosynthesis/export family protein [Pseudoxanthomonas sp. GM95]SEK80238.1 polysaccharide export outer membrane protein [Pseudoxanthomonas sp. GM95]
MAPTAPSPRSPFLLFALACLVFLSSCSSTRDMASSLPAPDPLGELKETPEYRIGAGDLIQIQVFQIEDLERQVRVDNEGMISLPLIGNFKAAGLTRTELENSITQAYGSKFLQDPQVSVLIQEFTSQRITVSGAVSKPGNYPLEGATQLTLQQALAEAQGVSDLASRKNVVVFRTIGGQKMIARFDLTQIETGSAPDPEIYGGDIVVVYRSDARLLLKTVLELTPFVMVFRAYR